MEAHFQEHRSLSRPFVGHLPLINYWLKNLCRSNHPIRFCLEPFDRFNEFAHTKSYA